jgi:hypothetical protein
MESDIKIVRCRYVKTKPRLPVLERGLLNSNHGNLVVLGSCII